MLKLTSCQHYHLQNQSYLLLPRSFPSGVPHTGSDTLPVAPMQPAYECRWRWFPHLWISWYKSHHQQWQSLFRCPDCSLNFVVAHTSCSGVHFLGLVHHCHRHHHHHHLHHHLNPSIPWSNHCTPTQHHQSIPKCHPDHRWTSSWSSVHCIHRSDLELRSGHQWRYTVKKLNE